MLPKLGMVAIVVALNGGLFDGAIHALDLPICPRMLDFGEPMFNVELAAHTVKDVLASEAMTFLISELNAVVREHSMNGIWRYRCKGICTSRN